jgi:hypothetical protein
MMALIFRQDAESESIICAIARSPTAWMGHVLSKVMGYSIDECVDPLLKPCNDESIDSYGRTQPGTQTLGR